MKTFINNKKWNITNSIFYFTIAVLVGNLLISCDDFIKVDTPQNQLIAQTVFEEKTTAHAAMTDIYSKMRDGGIFTGINSGITHLLGNYTDELDFYGNAQHLTVPFYNNSVLPSNNDVKKLWNSSYNQIYAVNAVIEGVKNSISLPLADKNQLEGEALFTRAFIHFYLTNLYGSIPYITSTDYEVNRKIAKTAKEDIYTRASVDLEKAIDLLETNYIDPDRTRPNKWTALALLSRVKLYNGSWNEASNAASSVLNETALYPFESNLNNIFLKGSTTTIWQLSPKGSGFNTNEGTTLIFNSGPPTLSALTSNLMSAFESGDLRKSIWTRTISNSTNSWSHAFKYKQRSTTSTSVEYSIMLRTGELYLIRAEARARLGELTAALQDLNKIRNNAGLGNSTATTQTEILSAILKERRVELFTELGHRFFDLKRFGLLDAVLEPLKPGWNSHQLVLPLPESEINLNQALAPQNDGY